MRRLLCVDDLSRGEILALVHAARAVKEGPGRRLGRPARNCMGRLVLDQAENRLHLQKSLLVTLLASPRGMPTALLASPA